MSKYYPTHNCLGVTPLSLILNERIGDGSVNEFKSYNLSDKAKNEKGKIMAVSLVFSEVKLSFNCSISCCCLLSAAGFLRRLGG